MDRLAGSGCCDEEGMRDRLILALDVESRGEAEDLLETLRGRVRFVKLGFELFLSFGEEEVRRLRSEGLSFFFDHKFYDIGRTVCAGVRAVARMGARCVTVHAEPHTMRSAVEGRDEVAGSDCKVLAVTVLTNMEDKDIHATGIDSRLGVRDLVLKRARQAARAGVDGVVASVSEAELIRGDEECGDLLIVTPGVRERGEDYGDQRRVGDVFGALRGGSDYIVVGRPIVKSESPREVFDRYVTLMMSREWETRAKGNR